MSDTTIPIEWLKAKLPSVADLKMGQSPSSADVNETGDGFAFFQGKAEFGKLFPTVKKYCSAPKKVAQENDILLSIRAPVGPTNLADRETAIGRGLAAISVSKDHFNYKYLLYYFRNLEPWMSEQGTGTTFKAISGQFLRELECVVPPLAEQKEIVDRLDKLLAQVEATQARLACIPDVIKRFRQSVLATAVCGKLTEEWRESNKLPLPKEVKLEQIICEGPQNGLYKAQNYYGEGVRIIRIDGFYDGEIIGWDKVKRLSLEEFEYSRWKLEVGDILVNRVNSIEYLGKSAIVRELPEPAVFESNIMKFRVNPDEAIPEYIVKFLCSTTGLSELRKNAKLAVNQASINQQDVKNCSVYLPVPQEQNEIVRRVELLFAYADTIEQQAKAAKERVDNLTQAILAKAFRGELTADWRVANFDLISGHNSAEALLARIQQERAVASGKKGKRGTSKARATA